MKYFEQQIIIHDHDDNNDDVLLDAASLVSAEDFVGSK